ncbi:hypothetical protein HID58_068176 [Brassica napus]|uniref:Uncharacterized protein n=1 Tax=Brassica napus TaxID=3708 RepID=A0ABQ7ZKP4_BRANA|nr:hypothetical protein HID58_068176 [Brassica napus]
MAERRRRYRARRLQRMIAARSAPAPSRFRVEGIVAIGIAVDASCSTGGLTGFVQKVKELPLLTKRMVWHIMDPDTTNLHFSEVRIFAVKNFFTLVSTLFAVIYLTFTFYSLVFSYYLYPLSPMLISTLYTASEFNFIPTGKLPHKIEILVAYASARIIWKPDNF